MKIVLQVPSPFGRNWAAQEFNTIKDPPYPKIIIYENILFVFHKNFGAPVDTVVYRATTPTNLLDLLDEQQKTL